VSVVSNTTVLSNFAAILELDKLCRLFEEVFLAVEVWDEVRRGLEEGYSFYAGIEKLVHPLTEGGWLRLTSLADETELASFSAMPRQLGRGEAASLAIAQHRGWLFLTDDRAAREQARKRGVRVSGTLGCLVGGVERSHWSLPQANHSLSRMVEAGYRSPVADLAELVIK